LTHHHIGINQLIKSHVGAHFPAAVGAIAPRECAQWVRRCQKNYLNINFNAFLIVPLSIFNPDDTRRLLLRTFVAQPCCGTFVVRLSWAVAELRNKMRSPNLNSNLLYNLCNKLRKSLSTDWSIVVLTFRFVTTV